MSLLYLIKFTIEYKGIPQKQFIKTWATEADVALKAKEKGKIIQIWKVSEKNISILFVLFISTIKLGYKVNNTISVCKINSEHKRDLDNWSVTTTSYVLLHGKVTDNSVYVKSLALSKLKTCEKLAIFFYRTLMVNYVS